MKHLRDTTAGQLRRSIFSNADICRNAAIAALFTLVAIDTLDISPFLGSNLTSFDRMMGAATTKGLDIALLISRFYTRVFLLTPLLFVVLTLILCIVNRTDTEPQETDELTMAATVSLFAFLGIVAKFVWPYTTGTNVSSAESIVSCVVLALLGFRFVRLRIPLLASALHFLSPEHILCLAAATMMPIHVVLTGFAKVPLWSVYLLLVGVFTALGVMCLRRGMSRTSFERALSPLFFSTLIMSLYIEARNVLNQRGVFLEQYRLHIALLMGIIALAALVSLHRHAGVSDGDGKYDWRRIAFPLILVSFGMVSAQPQLQTLYNTDFFERANSGVSTVGFLRFGEIPIIESHGAHMLSDYVWNILFGIVNGNSFDAVFANYSFLYIGLQYLILYYLLRLVCSESIAFLSTLTLPIVFSYTTGIPFLTVFALLFVLQNPTPQRFFVYWFTVVFGILYHGDIGLALGVACSAVLAFRLLCLRSVRSMLVYAATLLATAIALVGLFCVLCMVRDVNPTARLREFFDVMAGSNQNWAYGDLGNNRRAIFWLGYVAAPLATMALAVVALTKSKDARLLQSRAALLLAVFFVAYLVNVPRALVRHTLRENTYAVVLSFSVWVVVLAHYMLSKQAARARGIAIPIGILVFYFAVSAVGSTAGWENVHEPSLLEGAVHTYARGNLAKQRIIAEDGTYQLRDSVSETLPRATISKDMEDTCETLAFVLDSLLKEDETWVDFTNQSLLYALMGRNNPVYVNQSPGLLAGERTQRQFVSEVEGQDIPIALLPASGSLKCGVALDKFNNSYRYYRVAEYVYNTYVPLVKVGKFCIWCKPALRDAYLDVIERLASDKESPAQACGYDYLAYDEGHVYQLGAIPRLWGTVDVGQAWLNPTVTGSLPQDSTGVYQLDSASMDTESGNYLLVELSTDQPCVCQTSLVDENQEPLCTFVFDVSEGDGIYLVRASADSYWYSGEVAGVTLDFESESKPEVVKVEVLEGD